jgi:hypothetical protein
LVAEEKITLVPRNKHKLIEEENTYTHWLFEKNMSYIRGINITTAMPHKIIPFKQNTVLKFSSTV